jgi:hypothetical protein
MQTLKYSLGTTLVSAVMAIAPAGTAVADVVSDSNNTTTTTVTVDNSKTITKTSTNSGIVQEDGDNQIAIQGNCSGVFYVTITQSQNTSQSNSNSAGGQANGASVNGNNGGDQSNSLNNENSQSLNQSNSNSQMQTVSQLATGVNFSPNCSVTQVAAAGGQGGAGGGNVLAASTAGGLGAASPSVLPDTGVELGVGFWSSLAVVMFGAGSLYWRELIVPVLRRK